MATATVWLPNQHAAAAERPDFDAPFACAEDWSASSRSGHSPSYYSVDFNKDGDDGAPVLASAPGQVTLVRDLGDTSYGKYVVLDHGEGWTTLHAHLQAMYVVQGQWLDQGDVIGLLGTSGGSSGPHLHYEQNLGGSNQHAYFDNTKLTYGTTIRSASCGDVPAVGDWNGDRVTDVGVFRRSASPSFRRRLPDGTVSPVRLGSSVDLPLTGDWNGDGQSEVGTWSRLSRTFSLRGLRGRLKTFVYGGVRDLPVTGDWDGDGRTEVGVYRPATGAFRLRARDGSLTRYTFGSPSAAPVTGDWNGDGRTDVGTYDQGAGTWRLRSTRTGEVTTVGYGGPGRLPVTGDWDGDGRTDVGTWSPSTGTFALRTDNGKLTTVRLRFGRPR
ncbi:MAG: VCBS repeat domain-containing M23 family metallopeptidase [Actinomycetota bacterium]|nr:VCBS repeat domain-containing M23 family metallopeptidase [Actinomycetota bacterium]